MSERITELVAALRILAASPENQLQYLQELGLPQAVDELALEYDAIAAAIDDMLLTGEIGRNQYQCAKHLNERLTQMSARMDARLWTVEAVCEAAEWHDIRRAAMECLLNFEHSENGVIKIE